MAKTKEQPLQKQFETARACLERMCPPDRRNRRASVATSTVRSLLDYQSFLAALEQKGKGATGCRGLRGQLQDRAFEAESNVRVLLAEGVDSLNDLRDSGMLHSSLRLFAEEIGSDQMDLAKTARETVEQLQKTLELPAGFTDEFLRITQDRAISVRYDKKSETLVVRTKDQANEPREARIRIEPRAGDMGRIDVERFFGPSGSVSLHGGPRLDGSDDCHRRRGQARPQHSIDAYTAMLGSLAATREAAYGHARKVSQYGHGTALRAEDPTGGWLIVAGIALTVVVIAAIVAAIPGASPTFTFFGSTVSIAAAIAIVAAIAFIPAIIVACLLAVGSALFWLW